MRIRPVQREVARFRSDPASMRNAMLVIISVTVSAVLVGSFFMWLFDRDNFPNFGLAFWFVLQTVTTVGYGDVTPTSPEGRVVAGIVMIVAIAFLSITTAIITSTFVEAAQRQRHDDASSAEQDRDDEVDARFDEILERLTAIEDAIARPSEPAVPAPAATPAPAPPVPPPANDPHA